MKVQPVYFDAEDAVELGELLEFLGRWLANDREGLGASIAYFVANDAYGIDELRDDVSRFAFMFGGDGDLIVSRLDR
jgi:hypothetical protein